VVGDIADNTQVIYTCYAIEEEFEDTNGVIRRTDNAMAKKKKGKRTNNDLQNTTQNTTDRSTPNILFV
jgi:hypothetical protein